MHKDTLQQAEEDFNARMKTEFTNLLKGKVAQLTKQELHDRIRKFLSNNCIGTLATCTDNVPRSTPVRYRSKDLTIYIMTEGGGKLYNIRQNPRVCFSLYGKYAGFNTVRGLQLWGTAEIIPPEDKDNYLHAYQVINPGEREDLKNINLDQVRAEMFIIKINPERVRFLSFPQGILNDELDLDNKSA